VADPKPSLIERLYAEHRAALQSFFHRRIRSKANAPDLAQEVYVRMLRVSDPSSIRNPAVYLYTVANNLVKEFAALDRRQAGARDIEDARTSEHLEPETATALEGELDSRERIAELQVILRQLRPKCRAAIVLRFVHELTYREIATHLGISPQMARKYVDQALAHCQRHVAPLG
jgi:RNA polymerase sigma-70 factor (ECF subfamily)